MFSITGYTISTIIHEGTRSLVCRGTRNTDNTSVVLKILHRNYPSPEELARFRREYEISKNLKIDEVVQVYALESYKKSLAIVMEDFNGISLAEILHTQKLSVSEFLDLALKICAIVGKIHQQHVMHKDLNPSNILLQREQDQVKIIDFGIAANFSYNESEIPTKTLEGTLAYIAPEQTGRMHRNIDYRSDFYSLGVTFYEMLLGFLPFQSSDTIELVHSHLARAPRPPYEVNQQIPKPISDIIMKLMAKTAEERYQSISGLMSDLRKCREQLQFAGHIQYVAIGQDDVAESFHIPQTLYGREQPLQSLMEEFSALKQGARRCVLVSGYSGIGKTELIQALQTPVLEQGGYFSSGRFEDFKKHVQYSAILQALQELFQQILTEDDARLLQWKEKIVSVLGENAQILIELIPELGIILGSQHKAPSLSSTEARKRVQRILLDILPLFGSVERPLLIFLDNLHWIDSLSGGFLQQLLTRPDMRHLIVIGAYRNHEVTPDHPLAKLIADLRLEELPLLEIELAPLSLAVLSRLLADTLHDSKETLIPLAKLILEKTGGNPLAVKEFLKLIHTEHLLSFDLQSGHWQWSLEQIQGMNMTENVVEFMAAKIQKLPLNTQRFLQCAACIGSRCDLHMIAAVMECTEAEAASEIERVIHEGFLRPSDESYQYMKFFNASELKEFAPHVVYNFSHNRFQEDALHLLPQGELGRFHLRIGRHLLRCDLHQSTGEDASAEIVEHLNLGADLIDDEEERVQLLQLNLTVGQHAKAEGDYHAARHYLLQGMHLLDPEDWNSHSVLTFNMYRERAELEDLSGDFGESERLIFESISHSHTVSDKTEMYQLLIVQYTLRGHYAEALDAGKAALKLLALDLPGPKQQAGWKQELEALNQALQGRDAASLRELPEMSDSRQQPAMQIFLSLLPAAAQCAPLLYHLLRIRLMNDSLTHGLSSESASIFAYYGSLLASNMGEYARGYAFGLSGLALSEKLQAPAQTSRVSLILASELSCWVQPLQQAHRFEHDAYHKGGESGEFLCAGQALMHRLLNLFYEGTNLEQLMED
ncbi:MAG: serine/threonine-protein kinase PknK, partial [bacterium]|nr:serine/threonine-protein kinase PknK [bacterium]